MLPIAAPTCPNPCPILLHECSGYFKEELPKYYQYQTRIVAYVTNKNACHVRIYIEGWWGIRCELRHSSLLDVEVLVATE